MRWPWQKRAPEIPDELLKAMKEIPWPTIESLKNYRPPDPLPEDVTPESVYEVVRAIEDRARRLQRAAETHFMRKHVPGWHNRSWRAWRGRTLSRDLWGAPIEYAACNLSGITALIHGNSFTGTQR